MLVGIDTGGTFTDLVTHEPATGELRIAKVPSTPRAPARAVVDAVSELSVAPDALQRIVVGSTIAINAILQRRGADVIFITTAGFEDIPYIQRINRRHLYDLQWQKGQPLVTRARTLGVRERIDYRGTVIEPLGEMEIERVCSQVERLAASATQPAIAISLLFSYVNDQHEQMLRKALSQRLPRVPTSISAEVAPIWREYERGSTVIADAYVKPIVSTFARELGDGLRAEGVDAALSLMKSNGGQIPASVADAHGSELVLSGLAGGLLAGRYYSKHLDRPDLITLDMGGTSADVGVVRDGRISFSESHDIDWAIPIIGSFVDMTTIGAGGSSIASFDRGGFLKVGPESAGADPGPAAYGRGGDNATVTDANLVLGRLNPGFFLGGRMQLDSALAAEAVAKVAATLGATLEEAALAIVRMANENMANAVRLVTIDRGLDHRSFELLVFGGAGPLHAGELAQSLGMRHVIVPPHPGLTSAFGVMAATPRVDRRWTRAFSSTTATGADLRDAFERLATDAVAEIVEEGFGGELEIVRRVKMRYAGQNYEQEIEVPEGEIGDGVVQLLVERFHVQHEAFYGYAMRENACELAQLNVTVQGSSVISPFRRPSRGGSGMPVSRRPVYFADEGWVETPIYRRDELGVDFEAEGPCVIEEVDSTTIVLPGHRLSTHERGALQLTVGAPDSAPSPVELEVA